MKMIIEKIILWPRNPGLKRREISFEPDKVNVIEGHSGTGKTALTHIIDYCLGSGKCRIPVGVIRDKAEWFGLLLGLKDNKILVARRNPEEHDTTGEMYFDINTRISIPERPYKNCTVKTFKKEMSEHAGLPTISMGVMEEREGFGPASFRDMAAFGYLPQNIIANPDTLFFKTDTYEHQEKLRQVFPLILGIVTADELRWKQQLALLKGEYAKAEKALKANREIADNWKVELHGYYSRAQEVGLLSGGPIASSDWTVDRFVKYLEQVVKEFSEDKLPLLNEQCTERAVDELVSLKEEEEETSRDLRIKKSELAQIRELLSVAGSYGSLLEKDSKRLAGVGWFKERLDAEASCPLCGSQQESASVELESLRKVAAEVSQFSEGISRSPAVLDREVKKLVETCNGLESKLNYIRKRKSIIEDECEEWARGRQVLVEVYRLVGRIEQTLESVRSLGPNSSLVKTANDLRGRIDELNRLISPGKFAMRKKETLLKISKLIGKYASMLELEHIEDKPQLNIVDLGLQFTSTEGRKNRLWELGSGANWMGYHVSTLLALHEYFLNSESSPVPNFLVIDQPTQVYCPTPGSGDKIDEDKWKEAIEEETNGVKLIFKTLSHAIARSKGNLQILITEHAEPPMWEGLEHIKLIDIWRGDNDFLIPREWL